MSTLEGALEGALLDAMRGDPWSAQLKGRLEMVARAILLRHGLGTAKVLVGMSPMGVQVKVLLPKQGDRVQQLVLSLDSAL